MDNITLAKKVDIGGMEKASAVEWRWGTNYRFFEMVMEKGVADVKCKEMKRLGRGDMETWSYIYVVN